MGTGNLKGFCVVYRCETLESAQSPKPRKLSFAFPVEPMSPQSKHESCDGTGNQLDPTVLTKELTCISEEGLVDMDFQVILQYLIKNSAFNVMQNLKCGYFSGYLF